MSARTTAACNRSVDNERQYERAIIEGDEYAARYLISEREGLPLPPNDRSERGGAADPRVSPIIQGEPLWHSAVAVAIFAVTSALFYIVIGG